MGINIAKSPRMMFTRLITIAGICTALATAAPALDVELIVDRDERTIELFMSLPGEAITPLFAVEPKGLVSLDGTVTFDDLRIGTAAQADWLIQKTAFRVAGEPAVFEAMSMMVHPKEDRLPFLDPIEGSIAMSVCNVPDPGPLTLDLLHTYAGFIAYPTKGYGALALDLPTSETLTLTVHEYDRGEFLRKSEILLAPGETLSLEAVSLTDRGVLDGRWAKWALAALLGLALLAGLYAAVMARTTKARAEIS